MSRQMACRSRDSGRTPYSRYRLPTPTAYRLNRATAFWPPKPNPLTMCDVDLHLAGDVGHIVEIAPGIGIGQIDGWRNDAVADRKDAGDCGNATGRAEQVPEHRLVRRGGQLVGVIAEGRLDGVGFGDVTDAGGGGVGGDVIDILRLHAGTLHGEGHCLGGVLAIRIRGGDVEGVRGESAAR